MLKFFPLDKELRDIISKSRKHALEYGLDFHEIIFKVADYNTLIKIAAGDGFEERYPHWRFGMSYNQLKTQKEYAWGKIYELVINTDPSYAYLLKNNSIMEQKLVISHVYGHSDFFKNNAWFKNTNKDMFNKMRTNADKIRRYISKYGQTKVENFIDTVLSLDNLVSPVDMFENLETVRNREENMEKLKKEILDNDVDKNSPAVQSYLRTMNKKKKKEEVKNKKILNVIEKPTRDILGFLAKNAPLEQWQSDIVSIIREEAFYFLPQRLTKIMNEGWASFWHSKIMTEKLMDSSEFVDFAKVHSSVMFMDERNFNPYKLGIELFRDIKDRWDKGQYGIDYLLCDNLSEKENWDTGEMNGIKKIFEVRKTHNDVTFLENFLTEDFCVRNKLFVHKTSARGETYIDTKDFKEIKKSLIDQIINGGSPVIDAVDSNGENKGFLVLKHTPFGELGLDENYAKKTLGNLYTIWKRDVIIETIYEEKPVQLVYNKDGYHKRELSK